MSDDASFKKKLDAVLAKDPRYPLPAYDFVAMAVTYTTRKLKPAADSQERRHVSGQELLDGFRELALEQFGCLAFDLFADWGIHRTEDVGNIVFNLVNHQLLGSSERDSITDFADGYSFEEAFLRPFQPNPQPPDVALPPIA